MEIYKYAKENKMIRIEWNGSIHYAALVPPVPVAIDTTLTDDLVNQTPVTRLKTVNKRKSEDSAFLADTATITSPPCIIVVVVIVRVRSVELSCLNWLV